MGEVYRAIHPSTGIPVAIKWLHRLDMATRFQEEARLLAQIQHPNIARFISYSGNSEEAYIVMEYVEGLTLEKLLNRQGKLAENYALKLLRQLSDALIYMHERQIIHRDLKASNIKVQKDSTVKILDFGIAKSQFATRFTHEGFIVGSTPYVAPEQFRNLVTPKIDTWALGVLFYQMLTGHLPFADRNEEALRAKIQSNDFLPIEVFNPSVSKDARKILNNLLTTRVQKRWSAKELSHFLEQHREGKGKKGLAGFFRKWISTDQ